MLINNPIRLKKNRKRFVFYISKWAGFFKISKVLTRNGLRIIAYHSFSNKEGVNWRPGLFMTPRTLFKRMDYLKRNKFNIVNLSDAIHLLQGNNLKSGSTVITIDDGWTSIMKYAHNILNQYSFPYTIYVTSYYSLKNCPIFNMVVRYMFWKTKKNDFELRNKRYYNLKLNNLSITRNRNEIIEKIIQYGETQLNHFQRNELLREIGEYLEVSYSKIEDTRFLNILSGSEIKELSENGTDIQLHTHRHQLPLYKNLIIKELSENKSYLKKFVINSLEHFCYPNGVWKPEHIPILKSEGIKSAVTCTPGLNYSKSNLLALKRYVDSEEKSQIEFEAEVSGFTEVICRLRKSF